MATHGWSKLFYYFSFIESISVPREIGNSILFVLIRKQYKI